MSFQGKRMSIDWPQLHMREADIPNSTETKKCSANNAKNISAKSKKKPKAKADAAMVKADADAS